MTQNHHIKAGMSSRLRQYIAKIPLVLLTPLFALLFVGFVI